MPTFNIGHRLVGPDHPPLIIAEIGINHEGRMDRAVQMIDDACSAGCEVVKFQSHVVDDEMIPNDVVPGNTDETIWNIMVRCTLDEVQERSLKQYAEQKDMIYLSTPFSRAAADRLERLGVVGYKIGSGECNNYPLIRHIAAFGKPVILSTGMNDIFSIRPAMEILSKSGVPTALLHCTSMYPTPYDKVRLGAIADMQETFPDNVIGLSDHSIGNYTCFAAVALGASILEKHFTSNREWPGPDVPISIDPTELDDLIRGTRAVHAALGGHKTILAEETPTIRFAYACVVSTAAISKGEKFSMHNIWVKRPGTGEIGAKAFEEFLGQHASRDIPANTQLRWSDLA